MWAPCGTCHAMRGLETRLGRGSWGTLARPGSCPDENSVRLGDQYVALVVGSIFRKRNCPGKRRGQTDLPCQYLEFRTATAGSYSRFEPSATGPAASGPRLFENLREHRASLQINTCAALGRVDPRRGAGGSIVVSLEVRLAVLLPLWPSVGRAEGVQHRRLTASHLLLFDSL